MISIGLTGWSDHDLLTVRKSKRLEDYSSHFPFVELDTSFYAIPPTKNIFSWIEKTPATFQFIPKAFQAMTLHKDWLKFFPTEQQMFEHYITIFEPMITANRIKTFLFQFPPYFDCTKEHVQYLRKVRQYMGELPIAIEFRHSSWYSDTNKENTLAFLTEEHFIHTVVDQPQTPGNSVPLIVKGTNDELTLFRLHGQNYEGWLDASGPNWREKRTLYDYSSSELDDFVTIIRQLETESKEVAVIFNNNSGGHAAKNAKQLQKKLQLTFDHLAPQQTELNLFEEDF
ncbi:MAG: DUF72 domain-containing protein [Carnobacterium sp.]|uniref:DUF72 domain-containing protein n=1 Tax=Carnobacterium sp. TaxID=48221 RepID=UPI0033154266